MIFEAATVGLVQPLASDGDEGLVESSLQGKGKLGAEFSVTLLWFKTSANGPPGVAESSQETGLTQLETWGFC